MNVVNSTVAYLQHQADTIGMPRKMPPPSLGQVLRQAREAQGLGLRQLAELLETSPSQVSRWEADAHLPSSAALLQLVRVLELSPDDLFSLAGVPLPVSTDLPAMLRREYDLPPEAIEEIQHNIERVARKYQQRQRKTTNKKGGQP